MFGKWFGKKAEELHGAPAVRRLKTYSAQSGYVYQYAFEGHRAEGAEFVFSISSDRTNYIRISVIVERPAVRAWEEAHGRTLSATEWYAVAKMSLFSAFDERANPAEMVRAGAIRARAADVEGFLEQLGRD